MGLGWRLAPLQAPAAEQIDGAVLLRQCPAALERADGTGTATEAAVARAFCHGYLAGIEHLHTLMQASGLVSLFCLAPGTDVTQVVRVLLDYLRRHPERMHLNAVTLVTLALGEAFPCPSSTP